MKVPLVVVVLACWLIALPSSAASLEGFLVYPPDAASGSTQPKVTAFSEIFWQTPEGGSLMTLSGSSISFNTAAVRKFVYLDESYWASMRNGAGHALFAGKASGRETVIPGVRSEIYSEDDIRPYLAGAKTLGELMAASPDFRPVLQPVEDTLNAEIAHFQKGERKLKGQWINEKDFAQRYSQSAATPVAAGANAAKLDLITADGKTYRNATNVKVSHDDVTFLYEDGGAKIDLSLLIPALQKKFGYDAKARAERKQKVESSLVEDWVQDPKAVTFLQTRAAKELADFKAATAKKDLTGQVVLKDEEGMKRDGIRVLLFLESQLDLSLAPKKEQAAKELSRLDAELSEAPQGSMKNDTKANVLNVSGGSADSNKTQLETEMEKARAEEKNYLSPRYIFSELPPALAETRTDMQGRFTLSLPPGDYVVAAQASRSTASREDDYWWLVKVTIGETGKVLRLTEDNLSSSDSGDSLIVSE